MFLLKYQPIFLIEKTLSRWSSDISGHWLASLVNRDEISWLIITRRWKKITVGFTAICTSEFLNGEKVCPTMGMLNLKIINPPNRSV